MGSRSTDAALVSAIILSDCKNQVRRDDIKRIGKLTVISIPSSARMRAAYVAARSAEACCKAVVNQCCFQFSSPLPHPFVHWSIQRQITRFRNRVNAIETSGLS